jgi:hypothetical protein
MMTGAAAGVGENRQLGDLAGRLLRFGGIGGLALLAGALALGAGAGWERFLRGYLAAFMFVLSLSLGGLFFTMLQHLTRAGWSVVVRRIAEGLAANLTWIWILFIPVAVALFRTDLYHWTHEDLSGEFPTKALWLSKGFWLVRAAVYFAVWAALSRYFIRRSVEQDSSGDPEITLRMQVVAAPGMILYAFTQTFAIVDWVMTLEPLWYSTIFGVYYFAASCCGFGSVLILACFALRRAGRVTASITIEHYHDLGKFLFAFGICFWAYIAFSQYMLIWYANLPEETMWLAARQLGGWKTLSILLAAGHFGLPFLFLISRYPKRFPRALIAAAVWMLLAHFVDVYWLVVPRVPHELIQAAGSYAELVERFPAEGAEYDFHWRLGDLLCAAGMLGLAAAGWAAALRGASLVPARDPRLAESLAFENY